jgi:hypothetical protein
LLSIVHTVYNDVGRSVAEKMQSQKGPSHSIAEKMPLNVGAVTGLIRRENSVAEKDAALHVLYRGSHKEDFWTSARV